jgi:hypothetical protein
MMLAHFFLVFGFVAGKVGNVGAEVRFPVSSQTLSREKVFGEFVENSALLNCSIEWVTSSGSPNPLVCLQGSLVPIRFATTGASSASVLGLPTGLTGVWANDTFTISGSPTMPGTYPYTVSLAGVCSAGTVTASGTITVQSVFPSVPNLFSSTSNLCPGDTVTLSVVPASQFLVYRWFNRGQPVGGPYGLGVLGLAGSQFRSVDSGAYTVQAINSAGCIGPVSNGVNVAILIGTTPVISQHPVSRTVPLDDTAYYEVQGSGYDTIQWEYKPVPSAPWMNVGPSAGPFMGPSNLPRLWVLAGSPSLSGCRFRARISGLSRCVQDVWTQEATLSVQQLTPFRLRLDTVVRCSPSSSDTMLLEVRADGVNRVALAQLAVVRSPGLGWFALTDRHPSLFALNTQVRGDTILWSGFGNPTPALPLNSLLFRLKFVLPTSQTGAFPVRWLPSFSYMSDVYQGSWNLSLSDGGVEAVPVLVALQIRRQFLGGQYTDTLEVNPQPGAAVQWFLNSQPVAGGGNGRLLAVLGGDYTAVQSLSGCVSAVSMPFRVDPVGIRPVLDLMEPLIYPNPVQEELDIERLLALLEAKGLRKPMVARVVGMTGAVVGSVGEGSGGSLSGLSPGLYGLLVEDAVGVRVFLRFLKG